jgi:hypothetical protein
MQNYPIYPQNFISFITVKGYLKIFISCLFPDIWKLNKKDLINQRFFLDFYFEMSTIIILKRKLF